SSRRAGHLEPVAEEPETGHVGRATDSLRDQHLCSRTVEDPHLVDRRREVPLGRSVLTAAADQQAGAQPLREDEGVAWSRPALPEEAVGMSRADDREPVFRLGVADWVAA